MRAVSVAPARQNPRWIGLRCFGCDRAHESDAIQSVCVACGRPLRVDYDLDSIALRPEDLAGRVSSLWRDREMLPLRTGEVSLVEGWTPLLGVTDRDFVKDEARNPT